MVNLNTRVFWVIICSCFLVGCISLQHSADYTNRKTVIIFPIVNITNGQLLKSAYYDERSFFPRTAGLKSLWNDLSDRGYSVLSAQEVNLEFITPHDIDLIKKAHIPERLKSSSFDYSLIASLDKFQISGLASTRQLQSTLYLIDNRPGKLIWSTQVSKSHWRGLLSGPLDAIVEAMGDESGLQNQLYAEIGQTIGESFIECPLFKNNIQKGMPE